MIGALTAWWRRWRNSTARDVISALIVTAILVAGSYGEAHPNRPFDKPPLSPKVPYTPDAAFLLVAAACLVLAMKRRYPVTVLGMSTAAVVAYSLLGYVNGAVLLAPAIALFAVAQTVPVRRALWLAVATGAALLGATMAGDPFGPTGGGTFLIPALIAGPVFGGIAIANRRAYVTSIQQHAEDEARRRVDDERLRIARELHDIVAHTMATINVQAGVAEHVLGSNPAAVGDALHAIKVASKDGLRELRAILNVLRQADEGDPAQPVPGLAQIDALIAGACNAGLPTTLTRVGLARELPAAVDLAAYRIVQESLTNVIKHAGPASATVCVRYDDAAIRLDITDNGRGVAGGGASDGTGHGLIGMRERAASVGGTLQAGARLEGGYLVAAVLPAEAPQAESAGATPDGTASATASGALS